MKYSAQTYARAFVLAVREKTVAPDDAVRRFVAIVTRNGDRSSLRKITSEAERIALQEQGGRKVVIESARPLGRKALEEFKKEFGAPDVVEEELNPELIAGVRLTIGGEWMIDATLAGKLKKLFK